MEKVLVVGAEFMGSGIAQVSAQADILPKENAFLGRINKFLLFIDWT
jgi:3-hydroxyacyl-CoA dehydrogenase